MAVGGGGVHASGHQLRVERGGAHVMCVGGGGAMSSVWEGKGTCVGGGGATWDLGGGGERHIVYHQCVYLYIRWHGLLEGAPRAAASRRTGS